MRAKSVLLATVLSLLAVGIILLLAACNGGRGGEESTGDQTTPAEQETQAPAEEETQAPAEQETQAPAETEEPEEEVAGGEVDPCALVTKEEVETAIGVSVTEPALEVIDQFASCYFNDPETPIFHTVSVNVLTLEDEDQAMDIFEVGRENFETVTGIGEDAYWAEAPFSSLEILQGKYNVSIDVSPDGWDALAVAKELAAKALGRLP